MRNMTAILWCNGKKPSNELIKRVLTEEKEVFGVDGGADVALSAGINVKKVLGDFDSVNINDWKGKGKYLSNQNISDFGKSIKYLVKKNTQK
jgi:thiamine pyrophosphokinase